MKIKTKQQNKKYQKDALKHFRLSIIDAKLAYTLFKSLYQSRVESIVGKQLFDKYFWAQNLFKGLYYKIGFSDLIFCIKNDTIKT